MHIRFELVRTLWRKRVSYLAHRACSSFRNVNIVRSFLKRAKRRFCSALEKAAREQNVVLKSGCLCGNILHIVIWLSDRAYHRPKTPESLDKAGPSCTVDSRKLVHVPYVTYKAKLRISLAGRATSALQTSTSLRYFEKDSWDVRCHELGSVAGSQSHFSLRPCI